MIDKLTPEQEALIPIVREEWQNCFYSLPRLNEEVIKDVIPKIYNRPVTVWVYNGSPFGLQSLINILQKIAEKFTENIGQDIEQKFTENIGQDIEQKFTENIGQDIEQKIAENIGQNIRQKIVQKIAENIEQNIRQNIVQKIAENIRQNIGQNITQNIGQIIKHNSFGWYIRCDDLAWVAYYDFYERADLLKYSIPLFEEYKKLMRAGVFSSVQFENVCFVCALPTEVKTDERKRLHSIDSPAIIWEDGWGLYNIHGVTVPQYVVMNPEKITVKDIEQEKNAEIRRVKIDRYGQDRFLRDSGSLKISEDDKGTLWKKDLPNDEPIVMVELINSTPETDNSFKHYFIRVPPTIQTASEAVAWTFGKTTKDYKPILET